MGPTKTYLGAFLTLGSVAFAFFAIVGLAVGYCATPECAALNPSHRPLWALAIVFGTIIANAAMWFLLMRDDESDS